MTDHEMRIVISEACGWKCINAQDKWFSDPEGHQFPLHMLPRYHDDLNAIQTACLDTLGARERVEFCRWLDEVTEQPGSRQRSDYMASRCVLATARQRCEAFLRTIGKWKD